MNEVIQFRVVVKHTDTAVKYVVLRLGMNFIKTVDLLESSIVSDEDESLVEDVYVICCEGSNEHYQQIKERLDLDEIIYEGFKTLI